MEKEYLDLLKELIRRRPVTSDISAVNNAVKCVRSFLKERGINCITENVDGRDVLYASTSSGKVQDILFNAHLDVVPAMSESQFEPYEKEGRIYGRGAGDCLGNVVAIIQALMERKEYYVSAIFNTDEETGGSTALAMVERGYGARKAIVVADHYEDCKITYRQKGILILKLTAHGKGGHAAYIMDPEQNPIDLLARAYLKLRTNWQNPSSPEDWRDSMNGCIISGGSARNQIPDTAELTVNIRYTGKTTMEDIVESVRSITGLETEIIRTCCPVSGNPELPAYQVMKKCHEKVFSGREIGFTGMCGATDARHFIKLGIPIIIVAAAGIGAHSAEEYVILESLYQYSRIFSEYIAEMQAVFAPECIEVKV
ncbi:MAG: hypothetical protein A2017_21330 [Lentisphaerae bacterium GWF2_44_16]|nr:MAG: hypothetical protein A2017_21330 [Lentisphaerae bacterium GWF2_44_16]